MRRKPVGVELQQPLAHLRVVDEGVVGFLIDELSDGHCWCTPAQGEVEAPLATSRNPFIAGIEHASYHLG